MSPYDDRVYLRWTDNETLRPGEWRMTSDCAAVAMLTEQAPYLEPLEYLSHYEIASGLTYEVTLKERPRDYPRFVLSGGPEWVRPYLKGSR